MEVMGLMLGEFVDDYTVRVVDVRSSLRHQMDDVLMEGEGVCYATEWNGSLGRSCGSGFPDQDDGYVEADRTVGYPQRRNQRRCILMVKSQTGNSRRLVSLASWLRMLAVQR